MSLWTSVEAAEATGGRATADWNASGVSIDTRTLAPGDLFVALKAARDGHDFVAQALEKGAAAALVDHVPEGVPADAPLLVVEDVQTALEALGQAARARTEARVVAVTGSVGKTSTKEMLRKVLGGQGKTHAAEASYNNHWGVPLTLARMPRDTEFAVIEIGMNHPGEIAPLARMARPHVAMVTIVAPAHLEAFENIAGIASEKAAIFEGLEPGGTAIYNGDVATAEILREAAETRAAHAVSFGEGTDCLYRGTEIRVGDSATVGQLRLGEEMVLYKVAVPGRHFAVNALAVLATVDALGLDQARALLDLGAWTPGAGRGHRERISLDMADRDAWLELIDDSYNANPASVAASLEVLAGAVPRHDVGRVGKGRRIAYLGDMKELGPEAKALHAGLADHPAMEKIDRVHCVGPLMHALWQALPTDKRGHWAEDVDGMRARLARDLDAGDVVLVKASLSMGLGRLVDAIRKMRQGAEPS
ncbi:UDP-N-acetylmuramoyl-tripeptide--D-alanyl-D-alanine ligase [Roseivivax sp. THAF40]|uniref:UDP-N-acetylmuramoyl-tripeptide--D-alanyl-D- alanine ligase n=1 Tax=unclassified Roseivivax TaxID=2639302 RepID=UPI0012684E63|nr:MULTISPECIES: UDP-N-acetylmuramoyl-tripeptide--D-alanyl-D-alanine ligase [unclassified Roseivivax]QFS83628.1 UDP-N-acetylmuramoyl-tripeptide--D-alanyl-D-alanine ligase [Roseivivax sp. THAF197b]QFT47436.1 UDP-N-acetylmuramoyl-tripeptide--D-alanyl-D-alanine ligase [Roseivivax sp. THAF40]